MSLRIFSLSLLLTFASLSLGLAEENNAANIPQSDKSTVSDAKQFNEYLDEKSKSQSLASDNTHEVIQKTDVHQELKKALQEQVVEPPKDLANEEKLAKVPVTVATQTEKIVYREIDPQYAKTRYELGVGIGAGVTGIVTASGKIVENVNFVTSADGFLAAQPSFTLDAKINFTERFGLFFAGNADLGTAVMNFHFLPNVSSGSLSGTGLSGIGADGKLGISYDVGLWQFGKYRWTVLTGARTTLIGYQDVPGIKSLAIEAQNALSLGAMLGQEFSIRTKNSKHIFTIGSDVTVGYVMMYILRSHGITGASEAASVTLGVHFNHKYRINKNVYVGWGISNDTMLIIGASRNISNAINESVKDVNAIIDLVKKTQNDFNNLNLNTIASSAVNSSINSINTIINTYDVSNIASAMNTIQVAANTIVTTVAQIDNDPAVIALQNDAQALSGLTNKILNNFNGTYGIASVMNRLAFSVNIGIMF